MVSSVDAPVILDLMTKHIAFFMKYCFILIFELRCILLLMNRRCEYLLQEKGQEFVHQIQARFPRLFEQVSRKQHQHVLLVQISCQVIYSYNLSNSFSVFF